MRRFFTLLILFSFCNLLAAAYVFAGLSDKKILKPDDRYGRSHPVLANAAIVRLKPGCNYYDAPRLLSPSGARLIKSALKPEETLLYSRGTDRMPNRITSDRENKIIKAEEPLLRTFIVEYEGTEPPEEFCRTLIKTNKSVEIAEPYSLAEIQYTPNDPLATSQNTLRLIKAFDAWDYYTGDSSIVIGISDDGVLQGHEDLKDAIAPNWNEAPGNNIDDDANGYIDDFNGYNFGHEFDNTPWGATYHIGGHGTSVAGIATAQFNNELGMTGTAGYCRFFPMKTALANQTGDILFGYESILYAAKRGFKVLNCSWGQRKEFSELDQSIIDYAIARDVAIVASAGNQKYNIPVISIFYPANYFGVLGVGEVTQSDAISAGSVMCSQVDIMAPGGGNFHTKNNGSYSAAGFSGTSAAAPIVSGFVALIRGKYPYLNALQSLEFARQCVDDIVDKNYIWRDMIPGRINMEKAFTREPFSMPGVRPVSWELSTAEGVVSDRFNPDDTVYFTIDAHNYLGAADGLSFEMSVVNDYINTVSLIDSVIADVDIDLNADFKLDGYSFIFNAYNPDLIFFRIDIYDDGGYHDFFLLPYTAGVDVATFKNDAITFSVGDRGTLGFGGVNDNKQGFGFVLKGYKNRLWRSCVLASEGDGRVVGAYYGSGPGGNDYRIIKPFIPPNKYLGVIDDSRAPDDAEIGLEISIEYAVPPGVCPVASAQVTVKNISGGGLHDISVGYYFDWDVYVDLEKNKVRLFPEGLPNAVSGKSYAAAAEIAYYPGVDFPVFGSAVFSGEEGAEAQAAGMTGSAYSREELFAFLNNGTSVQLEGERDVKTLTGMKFFGELKDGGERSFTICFGGAESPEELAGELCYCLSPYVAVEPVDDPEGLSVTLSPNPAGNITRVVISSPAAGRRHIRLTDVLGNEALPTLRFDAAPGTTKTIIDLSALFSGTYFLHASAGGRVVTRTVVILK